MSDTFVSLNPGESTRTIRRPLESKQLKAWTSWVHESREWPTMVCSRPGPKILFINFNTISKYHLDSIEIMTNCTFSCTCRSHNTRSMFRGLLISRGKINSRNYDIAIAFLFRSLGRFSRYISRLRLVRGISGMLGMWTLTSRRKFRRCGARLSSKLTCY